MSETEIELASRYLRAAGQDAVGALIRSVRDLARLERALAGRESGPVHLDARPGVRPRIASPAAQ